MAGATVFHTGNAAPRTETTTDADGRFRIAGLVEGQSPLFVAHPAYHFHGQLIDTASKSHELKLLVRDQRPAPLQTLPPLHTREEEVKLARQTILPIIEAAPEADRWRYLELYAGIDPWYAYEYVTAHLEKRLRTPFVYHTMPQLYAADAAEALVVLESIDWGEDAKAGALLNTVGETPSLSREQALDLLERAVQHAKATTDPSDRVFRLSQIARWLFKLGKADEAKKIVETLTPLAMQLPPKNNAACTVAGEAISLFDLPAGLKLVESTRDEDRDDYCMVSLNRIALRLADKEPAEAERIAAEALAASLASTKTYLQKEENRDPTEADMAWAITFSEIRLVPLCYRLAAADPDRAERLAKAMRNPYFRAYAMGTVAKALADRDKPRPQDHSGSLRRAHRSPRQCRAHWAQAAHWLTPSTIAGALLPVVEQIDPTLVAECLWRAVSFRLHRPADQYLVSMDPEYNDACLAAYVARYDRQMGEAIFPKPDQSVTPDNNLDASRQPDALVLVNIDKALAELRPGRPKIPTSSRALSGRCRS